MPPCLDSERKCKRNGINKRFILHCKMEGSTIKENNPQNGAINAS